jgi:hypothetical protein
MRPVDGSEFTNSLGVYFTSVRRFRRPMHSLSLRKSRFKGGCFDYCQRDAFAKIHTHNDDALSQCGMCHTSTDRR